MLTLTNLLEIIDLPILYHNFIFQLSYFQTVSANVIIENCAQWRIQQEPETV